MQDFSIGLSGLRAAQTALDTIGNNVANAATEGFHRQRVEFAPVSYGQAGGGVGAGVEITRITRLIDTLLEDEITRQESSYSQISEELSLLSTVETTLGEFSESAGLNATIDAFFDALESLAAHPLEQVWRNEALRSAEVLTAEFRRIGTSLQSREDQLVLEARNAVDSINALTAQIAELNGKIHAIEIGQSQANNLRDHRDRLITELAGLVGVETQQREYGVVDVAIAGVPVVTGSLTLELGISLQGDGRLTITADSANGSDLGIQGGRLGALLALQNDLLGGLQADLDTLAQAIVDQVNRYHVQGIGGQGSFAELNGWTIDGADMASLPTAVTDGTFYIRLTNTATGQVQRHAIAVDVSGPAPDTLATIAAKIDALDGLSASVSLSRLHIAADPGYTFDFIPALLPEPTAVNLTAAAPPAVSVAGLYHGDGNHTFRFTVSGDGTVGNGSLQLEVTDEGGNVITTVNVGAGYAAGDVIELENGIKIAISMGDLNAGDSFEIEAFATTDTSGFLAAAGLNTFFSGTSASRMQVNPEIVEDPDRIATALGDDLTDNACARQLAAIREEAVESLGGMTPGEYYRRLVADLGQEVALKQSRQENVDAMIQNLRNRRDELSAVNINDEAAQLLMYENMFQAVAKYLNSIQTTRTVLMEIL